MYADLESLKSWLRIDDGDTVDDAELTRALQVASAQIRQICGRDFEPAGSYPASLDARYYVPVRNRRTGRWHIPIDDLATTPFNVYLWDSNPDIVNWEIPVPAYTIGKLPNPTPYPTPWNELVLPGDVDLAEPDGGWGAGTDATFVQVTAVWGWKDADGGGAIPDSIVQATLLQASRVVKRRDSPFGMVNTLDGSEQARLTKTLDPDVVTQIRPFIKYWSVR